MITSITLFYLFFSLAYSWKLKKADFRDWLNLIKVIVFLLLMFVGYVIAWLTGDKP
ncbi:MULTISPECIES: hypothetical protein [Bacillaceae]|uniref:hypothetical protein n=1 Tax=Bacillaceae TaxID=186817 RepID=UPI000A81DEB6|nr:MULTISPECIES: hypothetical protein [Bacillaceae]UOE94732.1 hypothetical protein MM271_03540 [Alkalihalobacillus sp. LMS39]